ncbi:YciI family protein [Rhodanobacter aciditrophus]|uniref:YciI family protein n=1 Tax=Rhodanobacter aciditrophus TaxID=1623218 RepID=UPI003CF80E1E
MQCTILIHEQAQVIAMRRDPARQAALYAPIGAYLEALKEAGVFVSGAGLEEPATATVLSAAGSGWQAQDGPYADTKEQLAGFFLIDVPDRAAALAWARRCPVLPGRTVELRGNLCRPEEMQPAVRAAQA